MEDFMPFEVMCISRDGWIYHLKGEEFETTGPDFKETCTVIGMSFDIGEGFMTYHLIGYSDDPNGYGYEADCFIEIKKITMYEVKEVEVPASITEQPIINN